MKNRCNQDVKGMQTLPLSGCFYLRLLAWMMVIMIGWHCPSVLAEDQLAGVMTDLRSTFGAGSTFIKCVYALEIFATAAIEE